MYAFTRASRPGSFMESLDISPSDTLDELRTQVAGYIRAKEGAENWKRAREDQRKLTGNPPKSRRSGKIRNPDGEVWA